MILKAPTGLYTRLLPSEPSDSSPVTWSISNKTPPPIPLVQTVVAPRSIVLAPDPPSTDNRNDYGELIFSVVHGKRSVTGSNTKSFEAGEVINFDDGSNISSSVAVNQLTIQHNTNVLDLEGLGLTEDEIDLIEEESNKASEAKRQEVAELQTRIIDVKIKIRENQKVINECNKAIKAVGVTFSAVTDSGILEKLNIKLDDLHTERTNLNTLLTTLSAELTVAQDELIDIAQVVR